MMHALYGGSAGPKTSSISTTVIDVVKPLECTKGEKKIVIRFKAEVTNNDVSGAYRIIK